jgi:hypothetical protein
MQRGLPYFLLVIALLVTALVYRSGLNGPFVFDDGPNIVHNTSLAIKSLDLHSLKQAALSSSSGLLMRPISMLSFAINSYATGMNPYYFKLTNLVIHIINGIGVFVLIFLALDFYRKRFEPEISSSYSTWISLAVASAWLLHPFNLTSVLYAVQRMTSLSAFFSIWGLVIFVWGRTRLYEGEKGILQLLVSLLLFTPSAMLSKENGALLPAFMLVIEISFFTLKTQKIAARRFLLGFYAFSIAVPAVAALIYLTVHPEMLLAGYKTRDFSLSERVMTEGRVLWFYLWQIFLPSNVQMGLYHDDIVISRSLWQPVSTACSAIGLVALLCGALFIRKRAPIITFGIMFFLVGHILESTIWPLEIAHEHRNYLPMVGPLLILFFYLLYPLKFSNTLRLRQVVVVMLIGLFAFNTSIRASKWANPYDLFQTEVDHHPTSALANGEMGAMYSNLMAPSPEVMETYYLSARQYFEKAETLDQNDTKALFGLIFLSANRGKVIEPQWVKGLQDRLANAPYAAITSDKLLRLTRCQLEGACNLSNVQFESLLKAALQNPTMTGPNRAKVMYAQSTYLINVVHNYHGALEVMYKMVEASPGEAEYRFALINFLVALKRPGEAKQQLSIVKQLDASHGYSDDIASLEKILAVQ